MAAATLVGAWWSARHGDRRGRLGAAAELRFLTTTLLAAGLVSLAWTTVGRWRIARRGRHGAGSRRAVEPRSCMPGLGAAVGVAVAHYDVLLASVLPMSTGEAIRFALTPLAPGRLAAAAGTVVLHAAAAGAVLVALALAALLWPVGGGVRGRRWRLAADDSRRDRRAGAVASGRRAPAGGVDGARRADGDGRLGRLGPRRAQARLAAGPARW